MKNLQRMLFPLLLALTTGCTSFRLKDEKQIPCLDEFLDLCNQELVIGQNDCSNKSAELTRKLREREGIGQNCF